jgi:Ecdysteroid kinase-like family
MNLEASDAVPLGPDDVDAAWLTRVLGPDVGPAARVVDVEVTSVGTGIGLLGQLRRYALEWAGGDGPSSVVAKFPAAGAKSRALAVALGMYPREVGFYRDLGAATDLSVGCHHAAFDERTDAFVLVLADMSAATTVDQLTGCTPGRAAHLVTALADHHARFWDEAGLERAPWLAAFADSVVPGRIADAVHAYWPEIRAHFADELTPTAVSLGDGLAAALPRVASDLSRPPVTLAHGDLRLDNLFFDEACGVRACDWQLTARSRGVRDLAYFLTQSLTPDDRAGAEADLVALYLDRLASRAVAGYDAETAWQDYRAGTILGFAYAIVAIGGLDQDDARSAALPRTMLRRSLLAMSDHKCVLPD